MGDYAVVLPDYEPQTELIAPVLQRHFDLIPFDARRKASQCKGYLLERVDESVARSVGDDLADAGVAAVVIEQSKVLERSTPMQAADVMFEPEFLSVRWTVGPMRTLYPWSDVLFLNAMASREVWYTASSTHIESGPEGSAPEIVTTSHDTSTSVATVDVFAVDERGSFIHMLLHPRKLHYGNALGNAMTPHKMRNFRMVVQRIAGHATAAVTGPGARVILDTDGDYVTALFRAHLTDPEQYADYNRWQLQMILVDGLGLAL